jgi:uncharacterized protein (TIGR03382 family)
MLSKSVYLAVVALAAASSAQANLVVNGGFEDNPSGTYSVGSSALAGWTIVGTPSDNVYLAPDGYLGLFSTQSVDLSGYSDQLGQGLEQTLTNAAGEYNLSLDIATGGYGASAVDVIVDGNLIGSDLSSVSAKTFDFTFHSAGDSTIEFLSARQGWVNHVDNVNVSSTPGPASMAVLGLNAFGFALRRKRSR